MKPEISAIALFVLLMFVCEKPFPGFGEGFLCIGKKTLRATGRQNVGAQGRRAGVRAQGRQNAYTHA